MVATIHTQKKALVRVFQYLRTQVGIQCVNVVLQRRLEESIRRLIFCDEVVNYVMVYLKPLSRQDQMTLNSPFWLC